MAYNSRKKAKKRNIAEGQVHIKSTFNNTIVTVTDNDGNVLTWSSAGALGYKGSKKSTPFAAGEAAKVAAEAAKEMGMIKVTVFSTGVGSGRETAIRAVQAAGIEVTSIVDETPVPHNGCRPSKRRRG